MNIPSVKVAVGIGGAFDMLSGRIRRAPLFFQRHGIEWLWRFILEPKKRFRRIYKAVLLFSYEIFKSRF
jgi:N-acetylglucosaminyldiphosphoundecaprenol N-acetyl-beta-D-mannosaminyltransferase